MQSFQLSITPQRILQGYSFTPANWSKEVIIAPAMGVTQNYYHPIATWLCAQGYRVWTIDLFGIGESLTTHLRDCQTDILDWAQVDLAGLLQHVRQQTDAQPVLWLGHSLGGQVFPLVEGITSVERIVTVASGTGYWRHNAPELRKKVWWFWFLLVPVLTRIYGYFPGKKLGMVGNLPAGVIRQWRSWCRHPHYCVGVEQADVKDRFDSLDVPLHSFALSDDEMLSERNIAALYGLFGCADKQLTILEPKQWGVSRIGHLGMFRPEFEQPLWQRTLLPALQGKGQAITP